MYVCYILRMYKYNTPEAVPALLDLTRPFWGKLSAPTGIEAFCLPSPAVDLCGKYIAPLMAL